MKILQCISSIDKTFGGPSKSVSDLSCELARQKEEIIIVANESHNPYLVNPHQERLELYFTGKVSYKDSLNTIFNNKGINLFHGHGIWQTPVHSMAKLARKINIPYVITPRGMLEPWALNTGKWKKRLAMLLYQRKDLSKAACIHATAFMEAENIRKLGFKNPIAVIPNGIDISEFPLKENNLIKEKRTLLFLSRIHPKKGIELLFNAWCQLEKSIRRNWIVEIVGDGDKMYINSLKRYIREKELSNEIKLIGPKYGQEKIVVYHNADLFVLPTHSENFGIVIAEALACEVPVITTKGTPWEELNTHSAGWWIDIGVQPLVGALQKALSINDEERRQMGINGRKLVEENYSIESVAKKMIRLYEWILNGGKKPEFVHLNK